MIRTLYLPGVTEKVKEEQHVPQFSPRRVSVVPTKIFYFRPHKANNSKDVTLRSHRANFIQ